MRTIRALVIVLLLCTIPFTTLFAQPHNNVRDSYMSLSTTGVDAFLKAHPTYDGRGVLVLIFDTGVDMSIPGLLKTSTGQVKVIDAIDFSNSCLVSCQPVTPDASGVLRAQGIPVQLKDVASLESNPSDSKWYMGYINEATYRSSAIRDFDGDGKSRSMFGVLIWRSGNTWHVAIDTDGDGSMLGETVAGNYRDAHDYILFKQHDTTSKPPLTFAARIDTVNKTVGFQYDMGAHGTHVAGIATGYMIRGQDGFNGVAPGAQVIACKFSGDTAKDNTVTGSMKRAYEYAARLSDSLMPYHTPVVVNMSFGIGSAYEGKSTMERFIDSLIPHHPNLYVVVAAGNEGPAVSTLGLPASSSALISVGALLPKGVAADMNMNSGGDALWDFSSRGGEVDKPDVLAPGTATSTVPRFSFDARESGTSMASPHVTGLVALLLSALRQEDSTWVPTEELIRRALRASAHRMNQYYELEQGEGVADVGRAFNLLMEWRKSGFANDAMRYNISVPSKYYPDGIGSTVFIRDTSGVVPDAQTFTVTGSSIVSSARQNESEQARSYTLRSTADWLQPEVSSLTMVPNKPAQITVRYDKSKLSKPGLYSARVVAQRDGGAQSGNQREFSLLNTIVVPFKFSKQNNYKVDAPSQKISSGGLLRYYFAPPPGASAIAFTLSVPKKSKLPVTGQLADKDGYSAGYLARVDGTEKPSGTVYVPLKDLSGSVVEVILQGESFGMQTVESTDVKLSAKCVMADMQVTSQPSSSDVQLAMELRNGGTENLSGDLNYSIKGYKRTVNAVMKGDTFSMPVVMRKSDGAMWITTTFAPQEYMRSTDILIRIVDSTGATQTSEAMNKPSEMVFMPNFMRRADSTTYYFQIIFGSSDYGNLSPIPVQIEEKHVRPNDAKPVATVATPVKPGSTQTFRKTIPASELKTPPGFTTMGEVVLKLKGSTEKSPQEIPFEFGITR